MRTTDTPSPKPKRTRAFAYRRIDGRTALGRRIAELKAIYIEALGGKDAISPLKMLKVLDAAELRALAEQSRAAYIRDGTGSENNLTRLARKAEHAERQLQLEGGSRGIPRDTQGEGSSPLADHFARPLDDGSAS